VDGYGLAFLLLMTGVEVDDITDLLAVSVNDPIMPVKRERVPDET
jgi:hypothetical protein